MPRRPRSKRQSAFLHGIAGGWKPTRKQKGTKLTSAEAAEILYGLGRYTCLRGVCRKKKGRHGRRR